MPLALYRLDPHGPPVSASASRLELDRRGERAIYGLRLAAAALTLMASLWLASTTPPAFGWVMVALGVLASVGWTVSFVRARRRGVDQGRYYLDLGADHLVLAEGDELQTLGWAQVLDVGVDEDRLAVVVTREGDAPLRIEPRYGSMGAYELADRVREAWGLAMEALNA